MEYKEGTKVFGNWIISDKLGEGASGQVFKIVKEESGITLKAALKVIRVPQSQDEVRRVRYEGMSQDSVSTYFMEMVEELKKEIRAMVELKGHPNIVGCDDYIFVPAANGIGGDILIRMELLQPLNNYMVTGSMPEVIVKKMATDLCTALDFCHKRNLIHRDIKPENIFVSATGQFKIGDFGLARTVEKSTGGLSKKGTESYMAPEVYLGKKYDRTVDIYSLGLVLYKSLNRNRLPFFPVEGNYTYADRENALSMRMQGDALPRPVDASDGMADIILKACAFAPERRYQTAEEMLNALTQPVSGTANQTSGKSQEKKEKAKKEKKSKEAVSDKPAKKGSRIKKLLFRIAVIALAYVGGKLIADYVIAPSFLEKGNMQQAEEYMVAGQYDLALECYKKEAAEGNEIAINNVAYMYENGVGTNVDYATAVVWYEKAAELGSDTAMYNLGNLYASGLGVEIDYEVAAQWYEKSAEAGYTDAMTVIGFMYENGIGVEQDEATAQNWYTKAENANK